MSLRCGWPPLGSNRESPCNRPATVAYVVVVHPLPLGVDTPERVRMALALCRAHDPLCRLDAPEPNPEPSDQEAQP